MTLIFFVKSALLLMLLIVCVFILNSNDLFNEILYLALFSIIMSLLYMIMQAPDVAITESAVGVCMTTLLLLWCQKIIGKQEEIVKQNAYVKKIAFFTVFFMGSGLLYAITDLPEFGDINSPINNEVYGFYLSETQKSFGFPNTVTAILAGFRGYDTLGETLVVFTAAISVLFLLKGTVYKKVKQDKNEE